MDFTTYSPCWPLAHLPASLALWASAEGSYPCAAMMAFLGLGQHAAHTSLAMMLPPVGILAVMQYHKAKYWAYAAVLCLTFVAGAWGGSNSA